MTTRPRHPKTTLLRQQYLRQIAGYVKTHGYPPSVRELGQLMGVSSSSTVQQHLDALETNGLIRREPDKPRTLALTDTGQYVANGGTV